MNKNWNCLNKAGKLLVIGLIVGALIAGCGGGGGSGTPATTSSTIISGVASKGLLSGSTVCAYAISGGNKGKAVGKCTTTDVKGNFSIDIGTYTGLVLFEATGGTYTDEATGTTVALTSPLRSMLTNATGGATNVAITALTELAYQGADNSVGRLTSTNIQTSVTSIQTNFGVPDIVNTMPADALNVPTGATTAQKAYALALATISQYQNGQPVGTSLANILQTIQACLANPATSCGTGTTSIGNAMSTAMTTFQASHTPLAGLTLPVAYFSSGGSPSPSLSFNLTSLTYAPQDNFTTSAAQTVTLSNNGNTGILLYGGLTFPVFGKWNITNDTCVYEPLIFVAGATCTISINFTPIGDDTLRANYSLQQQLGYNPSPIPPDTYHGVFEVHGDSVTNPQIAVPKLAVQLNGTGVYPLSLTPTCVLPQVLQGGVCVTPAPIGVTGTWSYSETVNYTHSLCTQFNGTTTSSMTLTEDVNGKVATSTGHTTGIRTGNTLSMTYTSTNGGTFPETWSWDGANKLTGHFVAICEHASTNVIEEEILAPFTATRN